MILNTPAQISRYHLATLRQAIKLEVLGLKHSSGKSANTIACQLLGLPKGTRRVVTIQHLNELI
jgi:hypothetical protein